MLMNLIELNPKKTILSSAKFLRSVEAQKNKQIINKSSRYLLNMVALLPWASLFSSEPRVLWLTYL